MNILDNNLNIKQNSINVLSDNLQPSSNIVIPVGMYPVGLTMTTDGKKIYVSNYLDGSISVIDTTSNKVIGNPIIVGGQPTLMCLLPNTHRLYVSNWTTNKASAINTLTDKLITSNIPIGYRGSYPVSTKNGTRVYISNFADDSISIINTAVNRPILPPITNLPDVFCMILSPDGNKLYVGARSYTSEVWSIDTITNAVTNIIKLNDILFNFEISHDGKYLYAISMNGNFYIVNLLNNSLVTSFNIYDGRLLGIVLSPKGDNLYISKADSNEIITIATSTNTIIGSPLITGKEPSQIVITANERYLYVVNSADNTVSVIDLTL